MTNQYTQANHGKLQPSAFYRLPAGAVRPEGFLRRQLTMLAEGLTGEMELFPDYRPESSEWRGGVGENWERGPYYLRGLVALAYVLDDDKLKEKTQSWIESILFSAREDGMFGPRSNEDWWSRMPVLMALCDYYEAKLMRGEEDARILPFMENYFRGQLKMLPSRPLESWAHARGGDNIDSVLWLYQKLYDPARPDETDWLIDLANLLASQTQDWVNIMQETTVREHVVNTGQAMKTPPLLWQISGDARAKTALQKGLTHIAIDHGRIDELPNSDEAARDNLSHRGSELCGIVEGMLSSEIAIRILGDPTLCDHLETLAYNALPCGYSYDYLGHVYYILQNQVLATGGYHGFDCDHGDSSAFGAPCGYDCCFSNHHMGWPKFVQSMWMATPEGGLATVAYGPCKVTATVAGGKTASFEMTTDYPFREKVTLTYTGEDASFPLKLRIPGWSKSTTITVCDKETAQAAAVSFTQLTRSWTNGDTVELTFTAEVKLSSWYNRSVGIRRGALIYSYPIGENWRALADNACRELKVPALGKTGNREVLPTTPWNMCILPSESNFTVTELPVTDHPFTPDSAPVRLSVRMKKRPDWRLIGNVHAPQPCGCCAGETVEADLIPYGSARLKLTHIPSADSTKEVVTAPPYIDGIASEFKQIVVPVAYEYALTFTSTPEATATVYVNDQQAGLIRFDSTGTYTRIIPGDLSSPTNPFRFAPEQYNTIRLEGTVATSLVIRPIGTPTISATLARTRNAIRITTNADPNRGAIFGELTDADGKVLLTVRGLTVQNRLPLTYPEKAATLRICQQLGDKLLTAEPLSLPAPTRPVPAVNFTITTDTAAEIVRVRFPRIQGADRYLISWGRGNTVTEWQANVRFNPYKGSGCFEEDITAFSVPDGGEVTLRLYALSEGTPIATSQVVTVDCPKGE